MKKGLELVSYHGNKYVSFNLLLMLLLARQSSIFKKNSSKENLVEIFSYEYGKIDFTLLKDIITVFMRLISIYILGFGFEKSLLSFIVVL